MRFASLGVMTVSIAFALAVLSPVSRAQEDDLQSLMEGLEQENDERAAAVEAAEGDEAEAVDIDEPVAVDVPDIELTPAELERQTIVRRQAAREEGLKRLEEGLNALQQDNFREAITVLERALNRIPDIPETEDDREQAKRHLADAHYGRARRIYDRDGDLGQAMNHVNAALERRPDVRSYRRLKSRIESRQEELRRKAELPVPPSERPAVVERKETVKELLWEARRYYDIGDYESAETLYERVLLEDEFNRTAMRFLKKIAERRYDLSELQRQATVQRAMQEVRQTWTPPILADVQLPDEIVDPTRVEDTPAERTRQKMKDIMIPSLQFRRAHIEDVVNLLVDYSIEGDPDDEGINIILNLRGARMREREAELDDDLFGEGFAAPRRDRDRRPAGVDPDALPTITLNLRRVSLLDALNIITEVSDLRYRIDDNVVVITPAGVPSGPVQTRMYSVQPTILDVIRGERPGERDDRGFGDFVEMGAGRGTEGVRREDLREFFQQAGVPFPEGTSITYNAAVSQLIVANTPENLERFERVLNQIDDVPYQVEIEARFVEIQVTDLRELGLEWILQDDYQFAQRRGSGSIGSTERLQIDADPQGVTKGLRYFNFDGALTIPESRVSGLSNPMGNLLSFSSVLTNPEMKMVLHALDQSGNTDLLSAPRVTTRSGESSIIQVVREIIYPTDFEVTEPTIQAGEFSDLVTPPTVTPQDFDMRPTGVILDVTPRVEPDGYTIYLDLKPEVTELAEWIQYGSQTEVGGRIFTYNIPQPVFSSRMVETRIAIWDGQTVVMGGLIREELTTFQDKIPLLGDIPLLGRLFRSEGKHSAKRNLMIFVTARLVDPAGKPVNEAEAMTMPGRGGLAVEQLD